MSIEQSLHDDRRELFTEFCTDHNFCCKWYTENYVDYVLIYSNNSTPLSFVEAASWMMNWTDIVPKYFPKCKVIPANEPRDYEKPMSILVEIGSIIDILKE